jgi:hypothetical protein
VGFGVDLVDFAFEKVGVAEVQEFAEVFVVGAGDEAEFDVLVVNGYCGRVVRVLWFGFEG